MLGAGQAPAAPGLGSLSLGGHGASLSDAEGRDPPHPALPPTTAPQVRAFLQPPLKGVVMETFGSGNGPTKPDLLQELQMATERGLVIVNCTHCLQGTVTTDYAAGMVVPGDQGLAGKGTA